MEFVKLCETEIDRMSRLASAIVKEHYDPILGEEQNDYMIEKFQSPVAIRAQIADGYQYYFARDDADCGFFAFYPKGDAMYLSKLYLKRECRGKGYLRKILAFIMEKAGECGLSAIELNVNKYNYDSIAAYEHVGFKRIRDEKNDIGSGYFMDDYVYRLTW